MRAPYVHRGAQRMGGRGGRWPAGLDPRSGAATGIHYADYKAPQIEHEMRLLITVIRGKSHMQAI